MASEPSRARLLWAILSLVLPVTFGHTTACRSPGLAFSTVIHYATKRCAPCSAALRHTSSSRDAFVHWSCQTESSEIHQEKPHPLLFFLPLDTARARNQFSEHHALRQSRILLACHRSREQDPPPAHNRLDALTSRLHERVQIENRMVGAITLSPIDSVSQEAVVSAAQRVAVARAQNRRDAAAQHCLECLGC